MRYRILKLWYDNQPVEVAGSYSDYYTVLLQDLKTNEKKKLPLSDILSYKDEVLGFYKSDDFNDKCIFTVVDDNLWRLIDLIDIVDEEPFREFKEISGISCAFSIIYKYKHSLVCNTYVRFIFTDLFFINFKGDIYSLYNLFNILFEYFPNEIKACTPLYLKIGYRYKRIIYDKRLLTFYTKLKVLQR